MLSGAEGPIGLIIHYDEQCTIDFIGSANPYDPDFWRKVYSAPEVSERSLWWVNVNFMLVAYAERLWRERQSGPKQT